MGDEVERREVGWEEGNEVVSAFGSVRYGWRLEMRVGLWRRSSVAFRDGPSSWTRRALSLQWSFFSFTCFLSFLYCLATFSKISGCFLHRTFPQKQRLLLILGVIACISCVQHSITFVFFHACYALYALCPMPYAPCPMPHALSPRPMPYAITLHAFDRSDQCQRPKLWAHAETETD